MGWQRRAHYGEVVLNLRNSARHERSRHDSGCAESSNDERLEGYHCQWRQGVGALGDGLLVGLWLGELILKLAIWAFAYNCFTSADEGVCILCNGSLHMHLSSICRNMNGATKCSRPDHACLQS